jgi:hypothetical protein
MGKKPVVGLIGLIWAGIALTGCESCRTCHNKYNAPSVFGAKPTASAAGAGTPAMIGNARPPGAAVQHAGAADAGMTGFSSGGVQPAGAMGSGTAGMPTGAGRDLPSAPPMPGEKQQSLSSPINDRAGAAGMAMPGQGDDVGGRMPASPMSRGGTAGERTSIPMPPRPVISSTAGARDLPPAPLSDSTASGPAGSPLPPLSGTTPPPPPGGSMPAGDSGPSLPR